MPTTTVASGAAGSLVPWEVWQHIEKRLTSTYELPFNAACVAIQEGRLDEAEELLHQAKGMYVCMYVRVPPRVVVSDRTQVHDGAALVVLVVCGKRDSEAEQLRSFLIRVRLPA